MRASQIQALAAEVGLHFSAQDLFDNPCIASLGSVVRRAEPAAADSQAGGNSVRGNQDDVATVLRELASVRRPS